MRLPDSAPIAGSDAAHVHPVEERLIDDGWLASACEPDAHVDATSISELSWLPARVPGTAAGALRDAGRWRMGDGSDLDAEDWWFRTRFDARQPDAGEELRLEFDGIATVYEVFLNGAHVLSGESMFEARSLDVTRLLAAENDLAIRCLALAPLLAQRRKPRARWRTRLVQGNLRFFRTMLLGRAPGFAPEPAAVGPWRPVRLLRHRVLRVDDLRLRAKLEDASADAGGLLDASVRLGSLDGARLHSAELVLDGPSGEHRAELSLTTGKHGVRASGRLRIPAIARWWPHTHGEPVLHRASLHVRTSQGTITVDAGRVGFRSLAPGPSKAHDVERDGLDIHVNGVRVFARGAVWTPPDPVGLAPDESTLRAAVERARDAGMNMLRIPGTSAYESATFFDVCDELGMLVWQDFMFANLDYPFADEDFRARVQAEVRSVLEQVGGRPSLAVLCGNSEVEQQVAMLGLDPAQGRGELFGQALPDLIAEASADAAYVPSAPCGGAFPFRTDRGVANYYGVGGYRRPLEDARRAEVRFAAECLAFSNVPDEAGTAAVTMRSGDDVVVHDPRWKLGVPRDAGSGWDFEDVRDHYLRLLFAVDPIELRRIDHGRYLELSRAVTGEVMAEVFGEWRRAGSPCGGGLVLWLSDLLPGAGWGVIDDSGAPKPAYHHLRRALAPVAVWMTDEGLGGIRAHVANDRGEPLGVRLRVALYRDFEQRVVAAHEDLQLGPHGSCERDVEALVGRFVDASWAYRFGPPAHDAIVASLEPLEDGDPQPLAQAFRFPAGRPLRVQSRDELGLSGSLVRLPGDRRGVTLCSRRLAYGVRVHVPGFVSSDDALTLEPGVARTLSLTADGRAPSSESVSGTLSALNLSGRVSLSAQHAPIADERAANATSAPGAQAERP